MSSIAHDPTIHGDAKLIQTRNSNPSQEHVLDSSSATIALQVLPRAPHHDDEGVSPHRASVLTPQAWENVQFATLCWALLLAGYNDGSTGPLLPRIREVYNVGFTVVSMLFIASTVGFVSGSLANIWLTPHFGFGKTIILGSCFQIVAYALQSAAPPFPAFVIGYAINGFGISVQDAQANGYVAAMKNNAATKMGILHCAYGVGAFAAPLAATQFSQMERWSFHFLVSLGISLINTFALVAVFRGRSQEESLKLIGQEPEDTEASGPSNTNPFSKLMRQPSLHLLAGFITFYVGVEVTIGGWIVTYIIEKRGGGPSAGYVSSGFFGGLALGRVLLLWVNKKIGERRVIFLYGLIAIGLELVVWLVPSLVGNAVAVSFIGLLLGPMYPIAMNQASRILPPWILTASIGWIAGFGQAGSAILPFVTGAIASKVGITALQPMVIGMMVVLLGMWAFVPRKQRVE